MIDFNDFAYCISDEMLAAYIDGNATESEKSLIENSISDNFMLSETVDVANDAMLFGSDFDWDLHRGDYGFWELGLPPLITEADLFVVADSIDDISTPVDGDSFNEQSMATFNTTNDGFLSYDITDNSDYEEIDDDVDNIEDFDNDSQI